MLMGICILPILPIAPHIDQFLLIASLVKQNVQLTKTVLSMRPICCARHLNNLEDPVVGHN